MEHLPFRPDEIEVDARLREALHRAYRAGEPDPALIDDEVLGHRPRLRLRPAWAALAAAAGLALAASAVYFAWPRPAPAALRCDADGSGRVDILDAFLVARTIAGNAPAGGASNRAWDVTGDGVVNGGDVDAIAAEAVSLGGAL